MRTYSDWDDARNLIRCYGWNTTCGQLLNPGLLLWFSADRSAVVGFRVERGIRVVAGAPVCDPDRLAAVVHEFEASDRRPACYFGAEDRLRALFRGDPTRSVATLGAQPVWTPAAFLGAIHASRSLRAQLARARNKGVTTREVTTLDDTTRAGVRTCLAEWLATRGLPSLHFLVEPNTLDMLGDRRLFVAERDSKVCAFVVLTPIPARDGYLTEQFVRGRLAPNGAIELVLAEAVQSIERESATYLTMGIVPLSPRFDQRGSGNPGWLSALLTWARAHARRFYDFDGLDAFKAKFQPTQWEPVYVIAQEPSFRPRTLYAIARAFTAGHPVRALFGGLARAITTELRWLLLHRR